MKFLSHTFKKRLGVILEKRLSRNKHIETVFAKINKTLNFLRQLEIIGPRSTLINIYQVVVIAHSDSDEVACEKTFTKSSHQNLEPIKQM